MYKKVLCLAVLFNFLAFTGIANADETFKFNQRSVSQPTAILTQVRLTDTQTVITIKVTNTQSRSTVRVFPPGTKWTYFIVDKNTSKKYPLLKSQGIAVHPNQNTMKPGEFLTFTLYFEKIPHMKFDLLEGSTPLKDHTSWHFTNIDLRKNKNLNDKAPNKKERLKTLEQGSKSY